jgi:hypothetical protein
MIVRIKGSSVLAPAVAAAVLALTPSAFASHTVAPSSVTIAGSLQSELGCPGDWQPDCAATDLAYDSSDDVWQRALAVPAGSWEYKAALNDDWTENYGANAVENGANIGLSLGMGASVKFYYDHKGHWLTDSRNSVIAIAPGSFQSELGCPGDWQPDCLRSWLQDPDGDGTYTFTTSAIPAGDYEAKVAVNETWTENYGAAGVPNGANIPFSVPSGAQIRFSYLSSTHVLTVSLPGGYSPGSPPNPADPGTSSSQRAAAIKRCRKKYRKGPRRKRCIKNAKKRFA